MLSSRQVPGVMVVGEFINHAQSYNKSIDECINRGNQVDLITGWLGSPVITFITSVVSLIAGIIAVSQFLGKKTAQKKVRELTIKIENIHATYSENKITQGEKSQFFHKNSGSVKIDNKG